MDKIFINRMTVSTIIGTLPQERLTPQEITIDAILECDMKKAGKTDNLFDAVDYSAVEKNIFETAKNSSFFLLEALADKIAETCLAFEGVSGVTVKIDKPKAAAFSESIAIEIYREKDKNGK